MVVNEFESLEAAWSTSKGVSEHEVSNLITDYWERKIVDVVMNVKTNKK